MDTPRHVYLVFIDGVRRILHYVLLFSLGRNYYIHICIDDWMGSGLLTAFPTHLFSSTQRILLDTGQVEMRKDMRAQSQDRRKVDRGTEVRLVESSVRQYTSTTPIDTSRKEEQKKG
jgi:hypothetical protein